MTARILRALEMVRLYADAAVVILSETAPSNESALVVASTPKGLIQEGTPFPLNEYSVPVLESDPNRIPLLLPIALRLSLPCPPSHAWTQTLSGTALKVTLAWSQVPNLEVMRTLASYVESELSMPAVDFSLRQQLCLENSRLQRVLGLLEQAVVTIDNLRFEARINRAAQQLLALPAAAVSVKEISEAMRRFQFAVLNQEKVAEVAGRLARQPNATVTDIIWRFARTPSHLRVTTAPLDSGGMSGRIWVFDDISEQMSALDAAQDARAQYRLLAENANDIVFRESANRTFEWLSDSVTATLGWSAKEMTGRSIEEFVHPDDMTMIYGISSDLCGKAKQQERQLYRARYLCKNGTYRWLEVNIRMVSDESGAVSAWVGSCRDVQEEIEIQQALDVSRGRLRASVDGMLDPQVLLAPVRDRSDTIVDFVYLEVNRAATEYLSIGADSLIGKSLLGTMPGLKDSGLFGLYVQAMGREAPIVVDDFLYRNEVLGQVRRYDIRGTRVGEELTLTWRDTTERYETQARIAESEQHYRLLAENSADVVALARGGRIDWVSPSLTRTLGWETAQWLGQTYLDFVHPDDHRLAQDAISAIAASSKAHVLRLRVRALSGQFHWAEVHADAYFGADGNREGVVASFRTIDAEVAAEAAVARLARFDTLTGLANRSEALRQFAETQSLDRRSGAESAVLFCDVDRFKSINDIYGHAAGDDTLRELANRIRSCVRTDDICARMGGDELLVILNGVQDVKDASEIAEKLRLAAERPIAIKNGEIQASLSIGVALAHPGEGFDQVMARADAAMYEAKKKGRNMVILVD